MLYACEVLGALMSAGLFSGQVGWGIASSLQCRCCAR